MAKMKPETLRALLDENIQQSTLWSMENIRGEQLRNLSFYQGFPMGNEVPGRSQLVSWDVFEVIESALPGFIEPFFSGDNIGEYAPRTPDDEPFADQATDYVNYLIKDDNDGFLLFNTWFKDALITKIGVVRGEWVPQEPDRETLESISTEQLVQLTQDSAVEIIEHATVPNPAVPPDAPPEAQEMMALHNVTFLRRHPGRVELTNVKPENFIVSRGAGRIQDARIVGEVMTYTRSDLAEMGYSQAMDVQSYDFAASLQSDMVDAARDGGLSWPMLEDSTDKTLEEVRLFRGYIRADVNGDGIAEWRYILAGGGADGILENEEATGPDYCVITPIPVPHRVIGMAYADSVVDIQRANSVVTRQYMDSLYLANRPRTYVNMDAKVDLDDLISDRIGGIIRGRGPAQTAIQPIQTTPVSRDALEGLQLMQSVRESRTGVTRYNQGLDAESLNKTATGIQKVMNAADKRQLMTLRIMAETGVKDLFKLVLRLVCEHQDQARVVRLRNRWVEFNPRTWSPDMDVVIAVGIGSGDKTETLMMLQQFMGFMQPASQVGIVQPQNMYEFGLLLAKNAKIKGAAEKLLTDPSTLPKNPPPPPPEVIKAQAQQQIEAAKLQADMQIEQIRSQSQAALERERMAMQQQTDIVRQQAEAEQQRMKIQNEADLNALRVQMEDARHVREMEFQRWKAELEAATKIQVAQVGSKTKMDDPATQAATREISQEVRPD